MKAIVAALFRAKRLIAASFVCIFAILLAVMAVMPSKYEARMSFLVRNERADPLISAGPHQTPLLQAEISEEQINSEVELLGSKELLSQVVRDCKLDHDYKSLFSNEDSQAVERATRKLAKDLAVAPVRKASVIEVSYKSSNRDRAAAVLRSVAAFYLEEHLRLHRAGGASSFFREQTTGYRNQLEQAEKQRSQFIREHNLTLLPEQKELTLRRLVEDEQAQDSAAVSLAETESRIATIGAQLGRMSPRITTQETTSANQYSVERLNTMLADLRNRHTDLMTKFRPDDPLVLESNQQIADMEKELADAKQLRSLEESTNVNPLHQSLMAELTTQEQTREGLKSRLVLLGSQVNNAKALLAHLESVTVQDADTERQLKEVEYKYGLFEGKQEEARIADSLDQQKISNVVLAERPLTPVLPVTPRLNLFTALLLALCASLTIGFVSEVNNQAIHTPEDFEAQTGVPVLATIPWEAA